MLKVEFSICDKTVSMRVLEQDEKTRGKELLYKNDEIEIRSGSFPDIKKRQIFLRGDYKEMDERIATINFESFEDAVEYMIKANKAIQEYNDSLTEYEAKQKKILAHYGEKQVLKTIEELNELSLELVNYWQTEYGFNFDYGDLASEIADVENMIYQIKEFFCINTEEEKMRKVNRTLERIEEEKKENKNG